MTPRRLIEPARLAGTSMLRTQSDARLVDLVRAGHASAFEAIVQRYRKPLLAYCSRLLPASRAEDAVQQAFLKAYQAMMSGDAELNLRPWLYRIAHNSSLNLLRQNGWSHEQLDENMDGVQRPDQALELRERLCATVAAVNALPERQRDAVLLREIEGLTYDEIAVALGVGDGAVRQLLHRARATLRSGLTAVTPAGLVDRVASALAGSGADPGARVAELTAGFGAGAGALKLGAAVLATGVIATGAVTGPLRHHTHHSAAAGETSITHHHPPLRATQVADRTQTTHQNPAPHEVRHHGRAGRGSDGRSPRHHGSHERSGDGGGEGRSSQPRREQHSGSGRDGSGTGGSSERSGSNQLSGGSGESSGRGGSLGGDGGGDAIAVSGDGSGGGGSDDGQTLIAPTGTTGTSGPTADGSGNGGSGSGGGIELSTSGSD